MSGPRLFITALLVSLLLAAVIGLLAWLLWRDQALSATILVALFAALLVLLTVLWAGYAMLQTRLLRPLRMLEEQLRLMGSSNAEHRLQLPDEHLLGELPGIAQVLREALAQERHQTRRAIDSATSRIEQRKARLEAILHDLTEGIVVCSTDHRIVLFNQVASLRLGEAGPFGLHRDIRSYFAGDPISPRFEELSGRYHRAGNREVLELDCRVSDNERPLRVRMTLIVDPDGRCNGYVLSFPGGAKLPDNASRYEHSVLSERPKFYDFSLFDLDTSKEYSDRPLRELTFVVFDTETTGLQPSKGDEIVQISGVRIVNGTIVDREEFDCLVDPGALIPPSSTRFHGITDDMVQDAPTIDTVLRDFHGFASDAVLVAHNAAFDMKFLKLKEERAGVIFDQPVLDTLLLSFVLQPNHSAHSLEAIASRFGVDIPPGARHTALGDARCTGQIFLRMLEALPHQGISTLREAMEATNQVLEIKRLQERF